MRFNAATDWKSNWAARFKPMTKQQFEAIEEVLIDTVKNGTGLAEINEAVASLCSTWNGDNQPSVSSIHDAILQIRGVTGTVTTPNTVKMVHNGKTTFTTMIDLKALLNRRPPPAEAWSLICTPMLSEQSKELLAYCDKNRIAYDRFVPSYETSFECLCARTAEHLTAVQLERAKGTP